MMQQVGGAAHWSRCFSQHAEINKRRKKKKTSVSEILHQPVLKTLSQTGGGEGAGLIEMLPDTKVFPADHSPQLLGLRLPLGLKCVRAAGGGRVNLPPPQEADHLLALLFICLHGCRRRRWRNLNEPGGGGGGGRKRTFLLSSPKSRLRCGSRPLP